MGKDGENHEAETLASAQVYGLIVAAVSALATDFQLLCQRGSPSAIAEKTRLAFVPPKPKELLMA
jgi:hypothetical protein